MGGFSGGGGFRGGAGFRGGGGGFRSGFNGGGFRGGVGGFRGGFNRGFRGGGLGGRFRGGFRSSAFIGFGGYWGSPYWGWGYPYYGFGYPYNYGYSPYYSDPYYNYGYVSQPYYIAAQPAAPAYYQQPAPVSQSVYPTPDFYLIAFSDGIIQTAVSFSVDGDTLHWTTREHVDKQAPLSTVDRPFSEQLNRERGVEFKLQ